MTTKTLTAVVKMEISMEEIRTAVREANEDREREDRITYDDLTDALTDERLSEWIEDGNAADNVADFLSETASGL